MYTVLHPRTISAGIEKNTFTKSKAAYHVLESIFIYSSEDITSDMEATILEQILG